MYHTFFPFFIDFLLVLGFKRSVIKRLIRYLSFFILFLCPFIQHHCFFHIIRSDLELFLLCLSHFIEISYQSMTQKWKLIFLLIFIFSQMPNYSFTSNFQS